jgi:guanylate kinase
MSDTGKLVLIIGPSGVGKSVILQELRQNHAEWHFPRSATTRERREGEGDDLYQFVTEEEFDQLIKDNQVLEWAAVHAGARYGTLIDEISPFIDEGKIVVREVDVQGFDSIRTHQLFRGDDAQYRLQSIFVLPENKAQLIEHITKRAPIDQEELNHRIASMEKELTYADLCDHQVVNAEGKLAEAVSEMEQLILN